MLWISIVEQRKQDIINLEDKHLFALLFMIIQFVKRFGGNFHTTAKQAIQAWCLGKWLINILLMSMFSLEIFYSSEMLY